MGASLTNIFLIYSGGSIVRVFFITAATFGAMSLYGYTTRTDLSGFGSFLFMGLIGIIIASLVNIFVGSTRAAVRDQRHRRAGIHRPDRLRHPADQGDYMQFAYAEGGDLAAKRSVYDALSLYLNFINLFMLLLQLHGQPQQQLSLVACSPSPCGRGLGGGG